MVYKNLLPCIDVRGSATGFLLFASRVQALAVTPQSLRSFGALLDQAAGTPATTLQVVLYVSPNVRGCAMNFGRNQWRQRAA